MVVVLLESGNNDCKSTRPYVKTIEKMKKEDETKKQLLRLTRLLKKKEKEVCLSVRSLLLSPNLPCATAASAVHTKAHVAIACRRRCYWKGA